VHQLSDDVRGAVAEVWRSVLGLAKVDEHVDFFDAGGDSLHALLVARQVRELGLEAPNNGVLRLPVLAEYLRGLEQPELFNLG
jgi:hypothetical protein